MSQLPKEWNDIWDAAKQYSDDPEVQSAFNDGAHYVLKTRESVVAEKDAKIALLESQLASFKEQIATWRSLERECRDEIARLADDNREAIKSIEFLNLIIAERNSQVRRWGNDFDDTHTQNDWVAFITAYAGRGMQKFPGDDRPFPNPLAFRDAMVKVGALAIAALEAHDRYEEYQHDEVKPIDKDRVALNAEPRKVSVAQRERLYERLERDVHRSLATIIGNDLLAIIESLADAEATT